MLPEDFEACLLTDELRAKAYESLGDARRALIKDQIAFLYEYWGGAQPLRSVLRKDLPGGARVEWASQGVEDVLLLVGASFASAPELVAALLPARLAGARQVLVCLVSGPTDPDYAVLSALDLLGQDEVYLLTRAQAADVFTEARRQMLFGGLGRVLVLGFNNAEPLPFNYNRRGTFFASQPLAGLCVAEVDRRRFEQAHPHACIHDLPCDPLQLSTANIQENIRMNMPEGLPFLDVIVCPRGQSAHYTGLASLVLEAGQEHLWVWPELGPEFFLSSCLAIGAVRE